MGIVLDSTALITAERARRPIAVYLKSIEAVRLESEIVLSVISLMELEEGYYRATSPEISRRRRAYIDEVLSIIPIQPVTSEIALVAASVRAQMSKSGRSIATADLLIGATALHLGHAVGTQNLRHFQQIPDLKVVSL